MKPIEFADTPLARDLHERYGWDLAVWERLEDFWFDLHTALLGESSPPKRGRIMEKYYARLYRDMGADEVEIAAAAHSHRQFTIPGGEPQWMKDVQFAANCMHLAPGLAQMPLNEVHRDRGVIDLTRYRHRN